MVYDGLRPAVYPLSLDVRFGPGAVIDCFVGKVRMGISFMELRTNEGRLDEWLAEKGVIFKSIALKVRAKQDITE